jgi:hypothetical protein
LAVWRSAVRRAWFRYRRLGSGHDRPGDSGPACGTCTALARRCRRGKELFQQDEGDTAVVEILGRDHRILRRVGTIPNPNHQGQFSYNSINAHYGVLIWTPTNGDASSFYWQMYLWNRDTGSFTSIAHNPLDAKGQALPGGWVDPQLTDQYVTWITASPDVKGWGGSSLMQYSLATGRTRTLYRGLVSNFVQFRHTVLFAGLDPHARARGAHGAPEHTPWLQLAVDADTGRPVPSPPGLAFANDETNTVVADDNMVVWVTSFMARAWRPEWKASITLVPDLPDWPTGLHLGMAGVMHPRLYKNFLVWQSNVTYVLDLSTNSFAKLGTNTGGVEASGPVVSMEEQSGPNSVNRADMSEQSNQTVMNLATLPPLPACKK